jgi:hypothetical protein
VWPTADDGWLAGWCVVAAGTINDVCATQPIVPGDALAAMAERKAASYCCDDDDDEAQPGQANGYGTVAVDLAAEAAKVKETMKALRAAQMDKPPPVAMKLNKATGLMEKFESNALKDDLPSEEEEDGDIDVGDMGCGVDDY